MSTAAVVAAINPFQDAKLQLEAVINIELNKIAILRKRLEALSTAINVLRSSDSELAETLAEIGELKPVNRSKTDKFHWRDKQDAIETVAGILRGFAKPVSLSEIKNALVRLNYPHTEYSLRQLLKQAPFTKSGPNYNMKYSVV